MAVTDADARIQELEARLAEFSAALGRERAARESLGPSCPLPPEPTLPKRSLLAVAASEAGYVGIVEPERDRRGQGETTQPDTCTVPFDRRSAR